MARIPGNVTAPEPTELLAGFSLGGFCNDAVIAEIACPGDSSGWSRRCWPAHIGIEQPDKRLRCFHHIGFVEGITSDCEEPVGMAGNVDLDITVFDVVGLGVVAEVTRQQAENAETGTGRADLDIGILEAVYDGLCPREQISVLETVVEVDTHDSAADTDTDAVKPCCGCRSIEGSKGGRVAYIGSACSARCIRHLFLLSLPQFIFPVAELIVASEKRRYSFKLNLHNVCLLSVDCSLHFPLDMRSAFLRRFQNFFLTLPNGNEESALAKHPADFLFLLSAADEKCGFSIW